LQQQSELPVGEIRDCAKQLIPHVV